MAEISTKSRTVGGVREGSTRRKTSDGPKLGPLLNLGAVRLKLGLDKEQMASRLTQETGKLSSRRGGGPFLKVAGHAVFYSRVHEWENQSRAVPDYAFIAAARMVIADWKMGREGVLITAADVEFASLFSQAYGAMLQMAREIQVGGGATPAIWASLGMVEDGFLKGFSDAFGAANIRLLKLIN